MQRWKKMEKNIQKLHRIRFFLLALPFLWEHHSLARPPLPRIAWNFIELKTSQRCSKYRLPHPVGLLWKPKNSLPWAFLGCLLSVGSSMWAATEWPNPCPTWSLMCAVFCIASIVWFLHPTLFVDVLTQTLLRCFVIFTHVSCLFTFIFSTIDS